MDLRTELRYPGATAAGVYALAVNTEFRAEVCRVTNAVDYDVDVQDDESGSTVVTVTRTLPAAVPDVVKRFVGPTIDIVQTETWTPHEGDGPITAQLSVQVVGQPASLRGTLTIQAVDDGAVQVVEGDVRVTMPLVGRRFEGELAQGIVAAAKREEQVARRWLSG